MRLLITGMGGELGTRVAQLLEVDREISEIVGLDVDPPRRRLRRAEFHRINPRDRTRVGRVRAGVRSRRRRPSRHLRAQRPLVAAQRRGAHPRRHDVGARRGGRVSVAARDRRAIGHRGVRPSPWMRDRARRETSPAIPTSPFGASLAEVEDIATAAGCAADVPVTLLRMAPVVGPHVPSPLGRYLRMGPVVPISAFADPTFSLLHQEDAVAAVIAAVKATHLRRAAQRRRLRRGHRVPGSAARWAHPAPDPRPRAAPDPPGRRAARLAGAAARARAAPPRTHRRRVARDRGAAGRRRAPRSRS